MKIREVLGRVADAVRFARDMSAWHRDTVAEMRPGPGPVTTGLACLGRQEGCRGVAGPETHCCPSCTKQLEDAGEWGTFAEAVRREAGARKPDQAGKAAGMFLHVPAKKLAGREAGS